MYDCRSCIKNYRIVLHWTNLGVKVAEALDEGEELGEALLEGVPEDEEQGRWR